MKTQLVSVVCQDCNKSFQEKKYWYGQSEVCGSCSTKRTNSDNCKRHGGKKGLNCYPCKLEGKF